MKMKMRSDTSSRVLDHFIFCCLCCSCFSSTLNPTSPCGCCVDCSCDLRCILFVFSFSNSISLSSSLFADLLGLIFFRPVTACVLSLPSHSRSSFKCCRQLNVLVPFSLLTLLRIVRNLSPFILLNASHISCIPLPLPCLSFPSHLHCIEPPMHGRALFFVVVESLNH